MARAVGGNLPGPGTAFRCKTAWTDPEIGNLVILDTTGDWFVDECAVDENPTGRVIAVNPAKDVVTIELFCAGMVAVLPYTGTVARGDKIESNGTLKSGTTEGVVKTDNTNGVGVVIAKDRVSGYVDVLFR